MTFHNYPAHAAERRANCGPRLGDAELMGGLLQIPCPLGNPTPGVSQVLHLGAWVLDELDRLQTAPFLREGTPLVFLMVLLVVLLKERGTALTQPTPARAPPRTGGRR